MKTYLLTALLFVGQFLAAQTSENQMPSFFHAFGLQLGFNRMHTLDRNSSALVYQGNLPTLGLHYEASGKSGRFLADLKIGRGSYFSEQYPQRRVRFQQEDIYGKIDSVSVPMRANNTLARISLGYLGHLHQTGSMNYQIGGILSNTLYYPQGFLQPGLMNVASLSPALNMDYHLEKRHFLSLRLVVPILNLVSRSTYNNSVSQPVDNKLVGFFDQGTRWSSLDKHREIQIEASYHFRLTDHWRSGLFYNFSILRNTTPRTLTMTQSELGLSLQIIQ